MPDQIDTTPNLRRPPDNLVAEAKCAIPGILAGIDPESDHDGRVQPDGSVVMIAGVLAKQIKDSGHSEASAKWAIHEFVAAGLLFAAPRWRSPDDLPENLKKDFEAEFALKPGVPAPYSNFVVVSRPELWEWWEVAASGAKETDVVHIHEPLLSDKRVEQLLLLLWKANDREAGIAVIELPEPLRSETLLTACEFDKLIEFGRRNHCHSGGGASRELVLENGWSFTSLDKPNKKRTGQLLHEALTEQVEPEIRVRLRLTYRGEGVASQLTHDRSTSLELDGTKVANAPHQAEAVADNDRRFMELAIEEARKSVGEDDRVHPKVGAVVVKDGAVLATAFRGELGEGEHAEYTALEKKLRDATLAGATIYATLEPCTGRNHPKLPCAQRLIDRKVKRVVFGMLDPNSRICGKGERLLRQHGIEVERFPHELVMQLEEMNRDFVRVQSQAEVQPSQPPPHADADPAAGRRPNFMAVLRLREDCETCPTAAGPTHWFRLWIDNSREAERSRTVEVLAYRAFKVTDEGLERIPGFVQSHLIWTYDIDRNVRGQILPSMGRLCDIGYIPRTTPGPPNIAPVKPGIVGNESRPFVIHTRVQPSSRFNELLAGKYKIEIAIVTDGGQPEIHTLHIDWTGRWHEEIEKMIGHEIAMSLTRGSVVA